MKYHTLKDAVRMGEYEPEYLSQFEEWPEATRNMRFQYIREAIENRRKILLQQYVAINNTLEFSQKPELQKGLDNNWAELEKLMKRKEELYVEYSI